MRENQKRSFPQEIGAIQSGDNPKWTDQLLKLPKFERLGLRLAVMSDKSDGDCRKQGAGFADFCARCAMAVQDVATVRQAHGTDIMCATDKKAASLTSDGPVDLGEADGLITLGTRIALAVFIADCAPLYLYDPKRGAAGLIHAGRQGTFQNIAGRAVARLAQDLGASPQDIHALVGPSAGPCCYEVSKEIAQAFADAGLPVRSRKLDLWKANARQLEAAGVPPAHIEISGLCTICGGRFHSYRAGATEARNVALLAL